MAGYHMRRSEKTITNNADIRNILQEGRFMTLALCDSGIPYIVTMNYGYDLERNCIWLHAATRGRKLDVLRRNPTVCATIVRDHGYLAGQCDHAFRSLVIEGALVEITDPGEKLHALQIMVDHLEPDPEPVKQKMIDPGNLENTVCILQLRIDTISGKQSL